MAELQAGAAYIQILPSMLGFFRRIQAEVRGGGAVQQDIEPRVDQAALQRARAQVERAAEQVVAARRREADAVGTVRTAEAALEDIRNRAGARASQIVAAEERVAAARRRSEAAAEALRTAESRERSAVGRVERLEVRADTSQADAEVEGFAARTRRQMGDLGAGAKTAIAGALAGAGVALGAALVGAIDVQAAQDKVRAQLGLTEQESARVGSVAGALFSNAYGGSMEEVNTAVGSVISSIEGMRGASDESLQAATASALDFASTFDIDVQAAVQSVGTLMRSGLASDATEAFDLVTAASQRVPAALRENILEASDEYGQFFNTLGFSGEQAFAMLVDASAKGEFGIDKIGDAVKEFTILSTDMSKSSQEAYGAIGLDAETMANKILAGGDTAQGATQEIISGLLSMKDPSAQATAAIALFGTPLEDLNVSEIPAFLQSMQGASGSMEGFEGSAERMGKALNDNAKTNIESFKRQVSTTFIDIVGGRVLPMLSGFVAFLATSFGPALSGAGDFVRTVVLPALSEFGVVVTGTVVPAVEGFIGWLDRSKVPLGIVAGVITTLFLPLLVALAVQATVSGVTIAAAWVVTQASAVRAAIVHAGQVALMVGGWVLMGLRATGNALLVSAAWLIVGASGAAAAARAVGVFAVMVAQWVLLGIQSLLAAAQVALAWLIAIGPIGLVIAAVIGLVALIIANWDTVKAVTAAVFTFIGNFLATVWGGIVSVFNTSVAFLVGLWNTFWAGVQTVATAVWGAVSGFIATVWAAIQAGFSAAVAFLVGLWSSFWTGVQQVASAVWNAVAAFIAAVWGSIQAGFNAAVAFLRGLWDQWWAGLQATASTVFGAILGVIETVWGAIQAGFSAAVGFVAGIWGSFWSGLSSVASTVFGAIRGTIDTVIDGIVGAFEFVVRTVGTIWGGIKRLLASPINFLINTVYNNGIVRAWNFVAGLIPGIGPIKTIPGIPEFARGGPVRGDQIIRAGEKGDEFVLSAPAIRGLGGMDAVEEMHRRAAHSPISLPALNSGRVVEGADHEGPGYSTTGFGGVKPHVAKAGHYLKQRFGIGTVGGIGQRSGPSDHPRGLALDFMTYSDQAKGDRLVNYLVPNAGHFAVKYIIWKQRINSGSGWRGMEDRGSVTANHFDHPHVSFLDGPGGGGGFSGEGGGAWFNPLPGLVRGFFDTFVNPLVNAIPGGPPRWLDIPKGMAGNVRDSALRFFLGLVGGDTTFDKGGLAAGRGVMFKNVIAPERTLDPRTTVAFEQLVGYLQRVPGSPSGGPAQPGMNQGGVEQRLDRLVGLLEENGAGATVTVEDRSGNPAETGRAAAMAIRRYR